MLVEIAFPKPWESKEITDKARDVTRQGHVTKADLAPLIKVGAGTGSA